jgi:hypothetical protein
MPMQISSVEASWLLTLLNDQEKPLQRPAASAEIEDHIAGLEATVRLLVSIVDPNELAAAIRLRQSTIENEQLIEWANQCEPPAELVSQAEERPW